MLPQDQPGPQGHSMTPPDTAAIAQGDPIVAVVLPAELSPEAQIGKRGFDAKCAECHGENAAGQNGVAPPLVHKIYESSHHSDMAFVLAAKNGVRSHHWKFGSMPPVKGLTDADVKYIARYIRELQRENGIN
ncbi:MAG: c-type cytochrome [Paracoccaceae bacterium]